MKDYNYFGTIINYMKKYTTYDYHDLLPCREELCDIKDTINDLISKNRSYLLTEDYLCYISISEHHDLRLYFVEILDHLRALNSNDVLKELHEYYTYIFDTFDHKYNKLSTKIVLDSLYDNPHTVTNIKTIRRILLSLGKPSTYYDFSMLCDYYDVIRDIIIGILCYATIYKKDFSEYNEHVKYIISHLDEFLCKLELNGICERKHLKDLPDYIDIDKLLEFLSYYLKNEVENTNDKTIN